MSSKNANSNTVKPGKFSFQSCPASLRLAAHKLRKSRDLFQHDVSGLDREVALYTAGFPCTPYSCLHSHSEMLEDKNSGQMWRCIDNISIMKPAVTPLKIHVSTFSQCFVLFHLVIKCREIHHYSDSLCRISFRTEMAFLENVLGFIRVMDVVMAYIKEACPEILSFISH